MSVAFMPRICMAGRGASIPRPADGYMVNLAELILANMAAL